MRNDISVKMKIKFLLGRIRHSRARHKEIDSYIEKYIGGGNKCLWSNRKLYKDTLQAKMRYGIREDEYFEAEFYRKSEFARKESLMTFSRVPFRRNLQYIEGIEIFNDKGKMYRKYNKFLGRDWRIIDSKDSSEVQKFAEKHICFFTKPIDGFGGRDIAKYDTCSKEELHQIQSLYCGKVLLEEGITQTYSLAKLNPSSVNTLRIITLITEDGTVKIAYAILRIGKGNNCVDNFSSGGISCRVNLEYGIIESAIDKNNFRYVLHPETEEQLIGFRIPEWERYKEFAIQLAKEDLNMRYMGWDIVMRENGTMCMIEGNEAAGFDIQEMSCENKGMKCYYEALLHNDKTFNYNRFS